MEPAGCRVRLEWTSPPPPLARTHTRTNLHYSGQRCMRLLASSHKPQAAPSSEQTPLRRACCLAIALVLLSHRAPRRAFAAHH